MFNKFAEGFDGDLKCPKVHFGSIVTSLPGEGGWLLCTFVSGAAYHQCMWPYSLGKFHYTYSTTRFVRVYLQEVSVIYMHIFAMLVWSNVRTLLLEYCIRSICVLSAMKGLYQYPNDWVYFSVLPLSILWWQRITNGGLLTYGIITTFCKHFVMTLVSLYNLEGCDCLEVIKWTLLECLNTTVCCILVNA